MLELSLSAVAAFAAYTLYAIVGDEIRANKSTKQNTGGQRSIAAASTTDITASAPSTKPKSATPKKARATKTEKPVDQIAATTEAILAYLSTKGPVTITNLTKELKMDKAAVTLAVEKLIAEKSALSIKRGGYPAIAPITN